MLDSLRRRIIRKFGGCLPDECELLEVERLKLSKAIYERDQYKKLAETLATYNSKNPVWDAQRTFRKLMLDLGHPIEHSVSNPSKNGTAVQIDNYLGSVVDAYVELLRTDADTRFFHLKGIMFDTTMLSEARGDSYLKPQGRSPYEPKV